MKRCAWRTVPLSMFVAASGVCAQCWQPVWSNEFATPSLGLSSHAFALGVFDLDGSGPDQAALYVGGLFQAAGGEPIARLARRMGSQWSSVGAFDGTYVGGLGVHDFDGEGPELPELVAVGNFTTIDGRSIQSVARWNGSRWAPIGAGFAPSPFGNFARTCSVVSWDHDGLASTPRRLVVSGRFASQFPGSEAFIMMWDGTTWAEMPGWALALVVFDEDGEGPQPERLFQAVDSMPGLLRWTGSSWETVGGGLRSALHTCVAVRVIDEDGPGPGRPVLFVGGSFTMAGQGPARGVAKWDGLEWSGVGSGIDAQVEDIIAVDHTRGSEAPTLYATGWTGNGHVWRYVRASGTWEQLGITNAGMGVELFYRLASVEDGWNGQPTIYHVAGGMRFVNGQPSWYIARLSCTCRANCDESTTPNYLTANDFLCFINKYAANDPDANCDGSTGLPLLTVNDFQCFLSSFVAGCP